MRTRLFQITLFTFYSLFSLNTPGIPNVPSDSLFQEKSEKPAQEAKNEARKFAEFRPTEGELTKVYGELLGDELKKDPTTQAHIIFYHDYPERRNHGRENHLYEKDYIVYARGIPENRITAIDGGYRKECTMELWIVPKGAEPPKPTPTLHPKKPKKHQTKNPRNSRAF